MGRIRRLRLRAGTWRGTGRAEASPVSAPPAQKSPMSPAAGFAAGLKAATTSVFTYVLIGTYISIGALGHDYGFSAPWVALSTLLVWAGPAQVILITLLGTGAAPYEVALAV